MRTLVGVFFTGMEGFFPHSSFPAIERNLIFFINNQHKREHSLEDNSALEKVRAPITSDVCRRALHLKNLFTLVTIFGLV